MRAISDEAVKALVNSGICTDTDADREYVCECIDNIPTIEPKRGKWIEMPHCLGLMAYKCNLCKGYMGYKSNFCPNCGAQMKGADDE